MSERTGDLNDTAVLDEEVLSPEAPDEEPAAVESAATDQPPLSPPQPGDANLLGKSRGTTIAFYQADEGGSLRIWTAALDGTAPKALPITIELAESTDPPSWSPDGASLAIASTHPSGGRGAIFIVTVETGEARLLVDHASDDRSPKWSPDGTMLAFIAKRDGRDGINVAFADSTGPAVALTHAHPGQDDHEFCWSHDGQRIAFCRRTIENDQVGDQLWTVNVLTGETKQVTKRLANRRQLSWSPDRALVIHIVDDSEWDNVAVVNADNAAGWNIASEAGDKSDPHYSSDGQRVVYTRLKDGVSRVCERAASSSSAEQVDPGDGMVRSPRFLPDKKVVYLYQPATGSPRFIVQEPKADAERTEIPPVVSWTPGRTLVTPRHAEIEIGGRKIGGLVYRPTEVSGPTPAVIYLAERPDATRTTALDGFAQTLVASGLVVFAVTLPGSAGYGRKVINALKEQAGTETVSKDLLAVLDALKKFEGIDYGRVALAGRGYGATLALLFAGKRPGQVQAVAAVDPITDWDIEIDHADAGMRAWLTKTYGLPALARGIYALRTPATFVGVVDAPTLLLETESAPAGRHEQMEELLADLGDLETTYDHEVAGGSDWEIGRQVAAFLHRTLRAAASPIDDRLEAAMEAAAI